MPDLFPIRLADKGDYAAIADVMYDAVRNGVSGYSEAQCRAWVPQRRTGASWNQRLESQQILVAESPAAITGCMSLADNEYIDLAFIRPQSQGSGTFRRLYTEIECLAIQNGTRRIFVHASLMAQPAFAAMGFEIMEKESVEIRGYEFERFKMEKSL